MEKHNDNAKIFISYRRSGETGFTGRIFDHLVGRYGTESVFRDLAGIKSGERFASTIGTVLAKADVVIAVIGRDWPGRRILRTPRIRTSSDWVRRELEHALASGIPVIPVLVGDTPLPKRRELPTSLSGLLDVNASRIRDESWDTDIGRLVEAIDMIMGSATTDAQLHDFQWQQPPEAIRPRAGFIAAAALIGLLLVALSVFLIYGEKSRPDEFDSADPSSWTLPSAKESRSRIAHAALQLALNELRLSTAEIGDSNEGYSVSKFTERFGSGAVPWSGAFVSWCFLEAAKRLTNDPNASAPFSDSPSNARIAASLREKGWLDEKPPHPASATPGDIIFVGRRSSQRVHDIGHAGIVLRIWDGQICSIEGNVNNRVEGRCRAVDSETILAIGKIQTEGEASR